MNRWTAPLHITSQLPVTLFTPPLLAPHPPLASPQVMTTVALKRATSEAQAIKQDMAQLQLNAAKHAPSTAATTYDSVKYKNSAAAVAAYDAKYGGDAPARMTEAKRLCRQQRAPPPPQQQRCKQSRLLSAVEALLAQDQVASNKRTSGGNSSTSSSKGGNPFMVDRQQLLQQEKLNSASSTTKPNSMVPARGNRWGSQGRPAPFGINNNAGVATGGASLVKLGSSSGHHGLVCNLAGEDDLDLQDVIRELEIVEGRISEVRGRAWWDVGEGVGMGGRGMEGLNHTEQGGVGGLQPVNVR